MFNKLKKYLCHLIPASDCLLCVQPVKQQPQASRLICANCHQRLPGITRACPVCAMPSDPDQVCGDCLNTSPYFHKTVAAFHYQLPVSRFISQLKYAGQLQLTSLLTDYLITQVENCYQHEALPDLIIPVPLHSKKIKQRGFNQSLEIARKIAGKLNIKLNFNLLIRVLNTPPQSSLDATQREKNLRNAFQLTDQAKKIIQGKTVALVDDVMTTGATVNELSRLLYRGGVARIHIWCIARAYQV